MTSSHPERANLDISTKHLKFDKKFISDLWSLLKPYWVSEEKKIAWILLLLNFICVFGEVGAGVGFNHFHKIFFDALQEFDRSAILYSIYYFLFVRLMLLISLSGSVYFSGLLSIRWRQWLTHQYLQKWLHNHNHYHMQILGNSIDNPDQRISEDLENFATQILELLFGPYMILQSVMYLIAFGYILWDISKQFIFHVGTYTFIFPGYLCWVALLYSVMGIGIITWLGKKLSFLDYKQQRFNADFRFGLIRFRESSEQISLYQGEEIETTKFKALFNNIFNNFFNILSLNTRVKVFNRFYEVLSYLVSFLVSLPFYLSKTIQLGTVMQISSAYASVVDACSIFRSSFSEFANLRSVVYRLTEFDEAMKSVSQMTRENVIVRRHNEPAILVNNLKLSLPNNRELLQEINLKINLGERILLTGASGIGKSTFLRALAGIWSFTEGEIYLPSNKKILFLPQKNYLPLGTLEELLCYPKNIYSEKKINLVLSICFLEKFKLQLNEKKSWSHELSLGEQQLISFARVFLYEPDLLFLDEATASLDEKTEFQLYQHLRKYLPNTTIITVGHRNSLVQIHEKAIELRSINQVSNGSVSKNTLSLEV